MIILCPGATLKLRPCTSITPVGVDTLQCTAAGSGHTPAMLGG